MGGMFTARTNTNGTRTIIQPMLPPSACLDLRCSFSNSGTSRSLTHGPDG